MKGYKYRLKMLIEVINFKKLFKIYDYFGTDNQMDKLKEELYELIDAIDEKNMTHILEEMSDVIVVMAQLILFGLWWSEFTTLCQFIDIKIKRTRKRIKKTILHGNKKEREFE